MWYELCGQIALVRKDGSERILKLRHVFAECKERPSHNMLHGLACYYYTVLLGAFGCPRMALFYCEKAWGSVFRKGTVRDPRVTGSVDYDTLTLRPASMGRNIPGTWQRIGDKIYVRCPSCNTIMMTYDTGSALGSRLCLICPECSMHAYFKLKGYFDFAARLD